jgi:F420-dependent oxidoreductase-like protein
VRFGIQIEPQFGFTFEDIRDIARDAEAAGFESLWVSDHLFLNDSSATTDCLEAWTLLAALTQVTSRLRLGSLVTCQSYRNPALLAKIAAGVDHMSGGRLEFGIGAGWKELEYRAYGYDFPAPSVRVEQLVDAIEICLRMWSEDKATYRGVHHRIRDAQCSPKPIQKPHPRVWIAGERRGVMRVAAKYADAVNVGGFPSPGRYAEVLADLDAACRRTGRDPSAILRSHFGPVMVAATQAEVDRLADAAASKAGVTRAEWLRRSPGRIVGTPDVVVARLREYAALGVTYVMPVFPYGQERTSVRLFADHVLPALA